MQWVAVVLFLLSSCVRAGATPCEGPLVESSAKPKRILQLPADWPRVALIEIEQNPFLLTTAGPPQVITFAEEDFALAINVQIIASLEAVRHDDALTQNWIARVQRNFALWKNRNSPAKSLAKTQDDSQPIVDVALNTFFAVFNRKLNYGTRAAEQLAIVGLEPELVGSEISPSARPKSQVERPLAAPEEVHTLSQNYSKSRRLTSIDETVADRTAARIFSMRSFRRWIGRFVDSYPLPLSTKEDMQPLAFPYALNSRKDIFLLDLSRYRDAQDADHIVISHIQRPSLEDFLNHAANAVEKRLAPGKLVEGITVPRDLIERFSFSRITPTLIEQVLARLSLEERRDLMELKPGQRALLKQRFGNVAKVDASDERTDLRIDHDEIWFEVLRTEQALALLSMW